MKQKYKVEIEIFGVEVEQTAKYGDGTGCGWYKFEYSIRINGGKKKLGEVDGSWSSQTKSQFTRVLKQGYASKLVLETLV